MALQQASPTVKLEASVELFPSTLPTDSLSSLFQPASPSPSTTVNPMEMMTPQTSADDLRSTPLSTVAEEDMNGGDAEAGSTTDKKPTKKRKSWGQVLPEPKTNLPPRKRAKTEDEKEQRRVERVLRNRRAAQSSRERKRLEVEALEKRNKELENLLLSAQKTNLVLIEELKRFRRDSCVVTRSSSPLDSLRDNPITLSQQLFGSQDDSKSSSEPSSLMGDLLANPTVNPASLSPELTPVSDLAPVNPAAPTEAQSGQQMATSDLTQRPAEMLCDLPCHMSEVNPSLPVSLTPLSPLLAWTLQLRMLLLSASAILSVCQRPLMQIAMSLKAGYSLLPTPQLLTTIIWLVTLSPASPTSTSSTSTTSSTTRQTMSPQTLWQRAMTPLRTTASSPKSTTLRFKSLRKILSSSPNLARPLMDATMEALRLVSERSDDQFKDMCAESCATRDAHGDLKHCLRGIPLPPREVLLTLLWALTLHEQRSRLKNEERQGPGHGISTEPTKKYVLKITKESHSGRHVGKRSTERRRLA
ncbi:hypothetical protein HIM_02859 [Hirsutella minnesotensis 3608]|nr:hypothetical protein HIM_02859 [Hirsutella minnesotensis 3608]